MHKVVEWVLVLIITPSHGDARKVTVAQHFPTERACLAEGRARNRRDGRYMRVFMYDCKSVAVQPNEQ